MSSVADLATYIHETLRSEPRQDFLWRLNILQRQLGQLSGIAVSHSPEMAPDARPMSGKLDACADVIAQTLYTLEACGMDLELVSEHALNRMKAGVWKPTKREDLPKIDGKPTGILAHSWKGGEPFRGTVHVGLLPVAFPPGNLILFLEHHLDNDEVHVLNWWKNNYRNLGATSFLVVAKDGGMLSHAATVCRELDIPCIVGLAEDLEHGSVVTFRADWQTQRAWRTDP